MQRKFTSFTKKLVIAFFILLPSITRILNYNSLRIHGDDIITAYFSAHYNFFKDNLFAPIPELKYQWVSQFPSLFFVMQKIFFLIFKEGLFQIKLSIIPYVLIISFILYFFVSKLMGRVSALVALVLYAFFSFSLYLETLGLHVISSTAFFLLFFYMCLRYFAKSNIHNAILVGGTCAFCYLFYTSSYLAFPLLVLVFIPRIIVKRKFQYFKELIVILLTFFVVLSPFLLEMKSTDNFYFLQRIDQVNLMSGEWSKNKFDIKHYQMFISTLKDNFALSFQSMYKFGIGGHGGYLFATQAFFEKFALLLFLSGVILSLFQKKKKIYLFILLIIFASFITGMVLTIPPPPFHRFSIAIPFIVIIMTLPFKALLNFKKMPLTSKYFLVIFLVISYSILNEKYFLTARQPEIENQDLKLSSVINKNYPGRNIYVASFPGYVFEKVYYFSPNKNYKKIETDYHANLLSKFNPNEKYLYVIIFPYAFDSQFAAKDHKGKIINFSKNYSIFVN